MSNTALKAREFMRTVAPLSPIEIHLADDGCLTNGWVRGKYVLAAFELKDSPLANVSISLQDVRYGIGGWCHKGSTETFVIPIDTFFDRVKVLENIDE